MTNSATLDQANKLDNAIYDLSQMISILQETMAGLAFDDSDPNMPTLRRMASVVDVLAGLASAAVIDAGALCVAVNRGVRITRPKLVAAE